MASLFGNLQFGSIVTDLLPIHFEEAFRAERVVYFSKQLRASKCRLGCKCFSLKIMSALSGHIGRSATILQNLKGHTSDVNCCDFAPNFTLVTGSSDKTVRVWDWISGSGYVERPQSPLRVHKYQVTCVRISPHGSMMASSSVDGTALLWNLHSLTKLHTMTQVNGDAIRVCSFSPDSTLLVTAGDNGAVCIWDLVHRSLIRTLFEHEGTTQALVFTPDCQFLVTACSLEVVKVWHVQDLIDTTTETPCSPLTRIDNIHDMGVFSIDISKHIEVDENNPLIRYYSMASGGCNNELKLWTIRSRVSAKNKNLTHIEVSICLSNVLEGHASSVTCVRFSNSGRYLVSSSLDKSVKVWDTNKDCTCLVTLYGHQRYVNCVAFSKDSNIVVSGSNDKLVIVWDLTGKISLNNELFALINSNSNGVVETQIMDTTNRDSNECSLLEKIDDIFEGGVNSCCFNGKELLATGSGDKFIRLFKVGEENNNVEELGNSPLEGHTYAINHVEFSKNGDKLASSSLDGCTFIWNTQTGEKCLSVPKNGLSIKVCRFSPNGKFIITGGDDEKAVIWNVDTMEAISVLEGHLDTITSACVSPDSKIVVTASCNADYRAWAVETAKCLYIKEDAHDGGIQSCDFSDNLDPIPNTISDRQYYLLATCGNDSLVKLWRISVEKLNSVVNIEVKQWRSLQGHGGNVISVRFSPVVGEIVCSTATDRQSRLWAVYGGHCLYVLDHDSIVTCCSFNSDCSLLATGCLDRTLWLWKLPQQLVFQTAIANKMKSRSKTVAEWSNRDVIKWLAEISMSKIAQNVRNSGLNGEKLITLTEVEVCSGLDLDEETSKVMMEELKWLKKLQLDIQAFCTVDIPHEFLCPITHEIMREPVRCSDGFTYEKNAVAEWFMSGKYTSPMTNAVLTNTTLIPNLELRDSIRKFLESAEEKE
ncbi:WD repeat, SAM and U-box domain-containing protein 1 isoform X3 [Dendroctonus ponderosae]|uniref:WD repeat, SAM and U-box domain-containing protein 1 isoform X3 n=1 Tax=Dendroctonus ponderosae TaxID=77166 RepID=UPI00203647E6|nr:WD repeat, SAM and U-box domain-containing protein 1 isoform X3 [Dendroctonus ponderosae]